MCSNRYNTVESGGGCASGNGDFSQPTIDVGAFGGFPSTYVMTSTPGVNNATASSVDFSAGETSIGSKSTAHAVLCVRDLP